MKDTLERYKKIINVRLDELVPNAGRLEEAMRYSLLSGGKRLRPMLTLEFYRLCGGSLEGAGMAGALDAACAVEMLHAYSLIHDDLPSMDNDAFRRGRPTNHVVYGERIALLAGDALQAEAFGVILRSELAPERKAAAARFLAEAAGREGMCGGQYLDISGENRALGAEEVRARHAKKTAALIKAACMMGCAAAGADWARIRAAESYGGLLGLAFQIRDDVLDVEGEGEALGKPTGSDGRNRKSTFVTLYGVDVCRRLVEEKSGEAAAVLRDNFEDAAFLIWLTGELALRNS